MAPAPVNWWAWTGQAEPPETLAACWTSGTMSLKEYPYAAMLYQNAKRRAIPPAPNFLNLSLMVLPLPALSSFLKPLEQLGANCRDTDSARTPIRLRRRTHSLPVNVLHKSVNSHVFKSRFLESLRFRIIDGNFRGILSDRFHTGASVTTN